MTDSESELFVVNNKISFFQEILPSLPQSSYRAHLHIILGTLRYRRFCLSNYPGDRDVDAAILHFTHAILLPFIFPTEHPLNTITAFYSLTLPLYCRSRKCKRTDDVRYCIKYLRFLRTSKIKAFGVTPKEFTTCLVHALGLQVVLEPGNAMQDIEEMSALCCELFSLDLSKTNLNDAIESFAQAVMSTHTIWNQVSHQVIECLYEVNMRLPDLHIVRFALYCSLVNHFFSTMLNDDYEEAMTVLDKILVPHSPTHDPDPYLADALPIAAGLQVIRTNFYGNPECLGEAISRCRTYLSLTSLDHPNRGQMIQSLVQIEAIRLEEFGFTGGLPELHSGNTKLVDLLSALHQDTSFSEQYAVRSPGMTYHECMRHQLNAVVSLNHITDKADIKGAAKHCQQTLTSLQQGPDNFISYATMCALGNFFVHAFNLTNCPEYLNKSIDIHRRMLEGQRTQWKRLLAYVGLIPTLHHRFTLFYDRRDLEEVMQLYPIFITEQHVTVSLRFEMSCKWATLARGSMHSSTSVAYNTAISSMQDFVLFAPTLKIQHFRLVSMRDLIEQLPLDYASYQIQKCQLKEAVETLEQGRGLLWSELRGMRTSIDQLHGVDSCLADSFVGVNQDLEALTTSDSGSSIFYPHDEDVDSDEETASFSRTVVKQRRLLDERTNLITQTRSLPGFENFLVAPSFDTLHAAASHGPVIVINHCHWRSDIIIVLYSSPPLLIPMPDYFYDWAGGLKDQLLEARKNGLDSTDYEACLISVLETLYELIGCPVIQRLQELNIPEQSRIWWCPTSALWSLPLHAMGPVRSEGPRKLYFSDLYISSYTPTLSALVESRKPGLHSFEKPSILLVAQPDKYMPRAQKEISLIQHLETKVTTLRSEKATPSVVMEHLQDHRFAHFSCHGILEMGKPFDASFKLYRGERLTLPEIIRSQLPSAEFAFLAACHTAELTEESIADEGLHLSAAVQYSGFRSVVGTMWEMADIDGPFLAKHFYESLFSERWQGVPYYERTAEALRDAVKELRLKRNVSTERWVNFVHYGA